MFDFSSGFIIKEKRIFTNQESRRMKNFGDGQQR